MIFIHPYTYCHLIHCYNRSFPALANIKVIFCLQLQLNVQFHLKDPSSNLRTVPVEYIILGQHTRNESDTFILHLSGQDHKVFYKEIHLQPITKKWEFNNMNKLYR